MTILVIGVVLRFYNFSELPYSHDELSALLRCEFADFHTLIERGVKTDFHPPGVQVFLYYWTSVFGTEEWIVKLPFAIASVYSIYLIYKIGKLWRNETVGLIVAAFLATTQITIEYGILARPYSVGLFFILLLFKSLLEISAYNNEFKNNRFWWHWSLFIIAGVGIIYSHLFGMLVAGLIGIVGLFMLSKKHLWSYILAGCIIVLLYLPNRTILFHQLAKGGVGGADGWLGEPDSTFLWNFIQFLFHYSIYPLILAITLFILGFFQSNWTKKYLRMIVISFLLFFIPFLIGYYYSIYFNPIIQFSVLIFSYFFLYFILFGHFKNLSFLKNTFIVSLIVIFNITTLVQTRKHFELIQSSYFEGVNEDLKTYRKEQYVELPAIIDCSKSILGFYEKRKGVVLTYKKYSEFSDNSAFLVYLDSVVQKSDKFYLGISSSAPPNLLGTIRSYFPRLIRQNNYVGGTTYLFGKKKDNRSIISKYSNGKFWSDRNSKSFTQEAKGYYFPNEIEYGTVCEIELDKVLKNKSDKIIIEVSIQELAPNSNFAIVAELSKEGKQLQWTSSSAKTQQRNNTCRRIVHTFELGAHKKEKNGILRVYLWNPDHTSLFFHDIHIYLQPGNPIIYGLNSPIDEDLKP